MCSKKNISCHFILKICSVNESLNVKEQDTFRSGKGSNFLFEANDFENDRRTNYILFVNLKQVYDKFNREALWQRYASEWNQKYV